MPIDSIGKSAAGTLLCEAALDKTPVRGLTHSFYSYPARFSPAFAATAIRLFSKRGDLVLDPYMGGGTTIVEALANGRRVIGNDLNELSAFVTTVKTRPLTAKQITEVREWVCRALPQMHYWFDRRRLRKHIDQKKTHNLNLPSARPLKKALAGALLAVDTIESQEARAFAKCVLLRLGQWALDNRKSTLEVSHARDRLPQLVEEMLAGLEEFSAAVQRHFRELLLPEILTGDASHLDKAVPFAREARKVDLVVTSPPYPGVHLLYHRWQINGRRETPAPYWISGTNDGHGATFYNFADRRPATVDKYFDVSLRTLEALHRVVKRGAIVVQLIAFSKPESQLPLYLRNMGEAGFRERKLGSLAGERIWRDVPSRKWHATMKGRTNSSREVVLIHEAR